MGREKGEGVVVVVRSGVESESMEEEQGQEAESVTTGAARSAPSQSRKLSAFPTRPPPRLRPDVPRLKARVARQRVRYADRDHLLQNTDALRYREPSMNSDWADSSRTFTRGFCA